MTQDFAVVKAVVEVVGTRSRSKNIFLVTAMRDLLSTLCRSITSQAFRLSAMLRAQLDGQPIVLNVLKRTILTGNL